MLAIDQKKLMIVLSVVVVVGLSISVHERFHHNRAPAGDLSTASAMIVKPAVGAANTMVNAHAAQKPMIVKKIGIAPTMTVIHTNLVISSMKGFKTSSH